MKAWLALPLCLFASSSASADGWHAAQIGKGGQTGSAKGVQADIYYDDGRLRLDQGKLISVVFEMRTGRMLVFDHRAKTFLDDSIQNRIKAQKQMLETLRAQRKVAKDAHKAALDQQVKMLERAEQPEPQPKPTGKKDKVGKFACEIYAWKSPLSEGELCLAKKVGVSLTQFAKDAQALTKIITELKGSAPNAIAMFGMAEKGFPVRTKQRVRQSESTPWLENVSEVQTLEPMKIGKAKFEIPQGYKKQSFPGMPAPKSKPKKQPK